MLDVIKDWYRRNFTDPQAVILVLLLLVGFGLIWLVGDIMAPVLVALVLAYLLEGVVGMLVRLGVNRTLGAVFVLVIFLAISFIVFFGLVPILSKQVTEVVTALPDMIAKGQEQLLRLPELYPDVFTIEQIKGLIANVRAEVGQAGQQILSFSIARLRTFITIVIYAVLVPLMVFFVLKDKHQLMQWAGNFVPRRSELSFRVWKEVDQKIANYIRGKFVEISIVWVVTYIIFSLMGLNFSLLLSFMVGLSVLVPFVGALVATLPIAIIAFFQWGLTANFWWLLVIYQIIVAVVFFGGIWGLWGVFFAIPLATLVQAVLNAWPKAKSDIELQESGV